MASTKLSALAAAATMAATDKIYGIVSAVSKSITLLVLGRSLGPVMGLRRNVKRDGATGNGSTDDTDAIQAAIDAVYAAGGGSVYFPAGTYMVRIAKTASATWKHALTLYPGVSLFGESRERSVIKLINGAGNYWAIFARALSTDTDMTDVGLYDLCIDQNNAGNIPATLGDLDGALGRARFALCCYGGHRVTVKNCWFKNFKSINTLTFNAPDGLCTDIQVIGNRFDHAVSASVFNDHSTIYTSCTGATISDNQFESPAMNTAGATTAIELHGSDQVVHHNIIKNFQIGCNFTGAALRSDNLHFDHNTIENAVVGVTLWSYFFAANTTLPALTNSSISSNLIRLNRDGWPGVYQLSYGIAVEQNGNAPMRGIQIKNNQIYFADSTTDMGLPDQYSCGIDWERGTGTSGAIGGLGYDQDIEITGNTIVGAYCNGIRAVAAVRNLTITDNRIRDCGSSISASIFIPAYRAAIMCFPNGTQIGWDVSRNTMTDRRASVHMTYGLAIGEQPAINCQALDNLFDVANAHPHAFAIGNFFGESGWFLRHVCHTYDIPIAGLFRTGSSVLETSTGATFTQVDEPEGANWLETYPRVFPGYEIAYGKADATGSLESNANFTFIPAASAQLLLGGALPGSIGVQGAVGAATGYNWYVTATFRQRWALLTSASSAADLSLLAFDDAGAYQGDVMTFRRAATGGVEFYRTVVPPASTTARASLNIAHGVAPTAPANGDMWTTVAGLYVRIGGITVGPLSTAGAAIGYKFSNRASVSISNTTATTTLLSSTFSGSPTFAANAITEGSFIRIKFSGLITFTGTPTLRFRVTMAGFTFGDTGAVALPAIGGGVFHGEILITNRTADPQGTTRTYGWVIFQGSGWQTSMARVPIVHDSTTVNTEVSNTLDVTATWGTASALNDLDVEQLTIEHIIP